MTNLTDGIGNNGRSKSRTLSMYRFPQEHQIKALLALLAVIVLFAIFTPCEWVIG